MHVGEKDSLRIRKLNMNLDEKLTQIESSGAGGSRVTKSLCFHIRAPSRVRGVLDFLSFFFFFFEWKEDFITEGYYKIQKE